MVVAYYTNSPWRALLAQGEVGGERGEQGGDSLVFHEHPVSEHYSTHTTVAAFADKVCTMFLCCPVEQGDVLPTILSAHPPALPPHWAALTHTAVAGDVPYR